MIQRDLTISWSLSQNELGWIQHMLLLKRTAAVLLGLVPLLFIAVGGAIVARAVWPSDPSWYSVREEGVLNDAFMYAAMGCVGLFGSHRLWRIDAGWKWTLVPIATLIAAVIIPAFKYGHHGSSLDRAAFGTLQRLGSIAGLSTQVAKEQGQFICDPSVELFGPSRFIRNGQPLPYVILCVPDATGPALANLPERPGTLLFAVSTDRKRAWFTATVLARSTDQHATWLTREGQPLVMEISVPGKD
ncbi:MAG: hypothetical protein ABS70_00920 [Nitrospira sp. SCN 59-13]|nr:MAG: hypothetical protein ABS70_00920 [Nitrospira sp. SCN 59-13]